MKTVKSNRKANKKEINALTKYLTADLLSGQFEITTTKKELKKDIKKTLKKLTILAYDLPKTDGTLIILINVTKITDDVHGTCFDKFVDEYFITKDGITNVKNHDYIPTTDFKEVELPTGLKLDDKGEIVLDESIEIKQELPEGITLGKGGDAIVDKS